MFCFRNLCCEPFHTATNDRAEVRIIGSVLADIYGPLILEASPWRIVDALWGIKDAELWPSVRQ